jgi:DNA ligase (NAD+)
MLNEKVIKIHKMEEMISQLNTWRDEYYNKNNPSVSDKEYDKLFDQLTELEKETGIYMSNSPTQTVGYEVKSELVKIKHNHPMLSLDKTKKVSDLVKFMNNKPCVLMLKMDGLTVTLRYMDGNLVSAETRGNGEIGEDITHNAKIFKNIPLKIDCKDEVIVDGEAIITYDNFEKINRNLPEDKKYKNPRNLASGSVRQLDSKIASAREIKFIAWKMIKGSDSNSFLERLDILSNLGFDVVPHRFIVDVNSNYTDNVTIKSDILELSKEAEDKGYPIDGMVLGYDDVKYGESLGMTGHHVRSQIAFKFKEEEEISVLRSIEWSMGKTGILTPVAVFDPVELAGTTVTRASLHNISIMKDLDIQVGSEVTVVKKNEIIPQIIECNADFASFDYPDKCPICGAETVIVKENNTEVLMCPNDDCNGKLLGKMCAFVGREAHDIRGLSEATLKLLIDKGYIKKPIDLFGLKQKKTSLSNLPGLGAKSVNNILDEIERCKNTTLEKFLVGLSIPLIGKSASKTIASYEEKKAMQEGYDSPIQALLKDLGDKEFNWTVLEDFGPNMSYSIKNYMKKHNKEIIELASMFSFMYSDIMKMGEEQILKGKTFVITGSLTHFKNRNELKAKIEELGGKVTGSVTGKTDYLINNDNQSSSSKNKKAKELGIAILTEEDFINLISI